MRFPLLVPAVLLGAVRTAAAQAPSDTVRLPAIVVTATRLASPREEVANAVTVLTGDDLARQGVTRVVDALREVAGVAVVQSGPPGAVASLFMRGGQSNYVRVLVDGVPVNQPGGSINLADLTMDNVERIEIVRGPSSALFGSDAVSGVIQILTRRGAGPARGSITAVAGASGASLGAEARGGTRRFGFSVGGSRRDDDGVFALNNRYRDWSGSALLRAAGARGDLQIALRHSDGTYHYPTDFAGNPGDRNQYNAGRLSSIAIDAGRAISSRAELRLLVGATSGVDRAVNPPDSAGDFSAYASRTEYGRRSADLRVNLRLPSRATLTGGVAVERERFWSSADSIARARKGGAVYGQVLAPVGARVSLTLGGRAERNDRFGRYATGRAGLVARVRDGALVRLGVGTAFKEPTFLENYGGGFATGNPALAPERSRSAEIGIEQRVAGNRAVVAATLFTQRFDSVIQYSFAVPAGQPNYRNVGGARASGLEVEAHVAPGFGTRLGAEWTWLHTAVRDSGVDGATFAPGHPLLRRPDHSGAVTLERSVGPRAGVSARVMIVGTREDLDYDPVTFAPVRVVLPAYDRLDLSGNVLALDGGSGRPSVRLSLRVENALNRRYEEALHFPARRRTVWLGVRAG